MGRRHKHCGEIHPGLNSAIESAQNKLQDLIDAEKESIQYRREAREETKAQVAALKEAEKEAEKLKDAQKQLTAAQKEQTRVTVEQTEAIEDEAEATEDLASRIGFLKKSREKAAKKLQKNQTSQRRPASF